MRVKTKIFSFFSGAGFLDYGFESEGFHVSFVNEFHQPFLQAYQYSRKNLGIDAPEYGYHFGSITDLCCTGVSGELSNYVLDSKKDGSLVGFIGGPPCPDFSVAGKNRGSSGQNGRLSQTYIDLIVQQKPDFFLFENVKGLWKTRKHKEFYESLKNQLEKSEYILSERLINSIEYGAPQDRERVILVGFKKQILKNTDDISKFDWIEHADYPHRQAFKFNWPSVKKFVQDSEVDCPSDLPKNLTVEYWFQQNDVYNHPNSQHCFRPRAGLSRFLSVEEGDVAKKSSKRLHRWRYSPTAAYGNNEVHLHPYKPRRLSVAEVLAIQSLPKSFVLPPDMTLSNMFKTVGNGVPYLAARGLARTIKSFLEDRR